MATDERVTVAWERLDLTGTECATLARADAGWTIEGSVVFAEAGLPVALGYSIACGTDWVTRSVRLRGRFGLRDVDLAIEHGGAGWTSNGRAVQGLDEAEDIDLAFSPATNLLPIRRLALRIGERHRVVSAWLRFPQLDLVPLEQFYERLSDHEVRFESPTHELVATLELHASQFPRDYPALWRMIAATDEVPA